MSYRNLDLLISQFPGEADAIKRLDNLLDKYESSSEFSIEKLEDDVRPSSTFVLSSLLSAAVKQGILSRLIRVESPIIGGIKDFRSITEVPDRIFDFYQDKEIEITPENIKIIYKSTK